MEDKYYCPDISEVCFGLPISVCVNGLWVEFIYTPTIGWDTVHLLADGTKFILKELFEQGNIRVKYLSDSDIKECGWLLDEVKNGNSYYHNNIHSLSFLKDNNVCIYYDDGQVMEMKFDGTIKNKHELLQVMKMLGINQQPTIKSE